MKKLLLAIIVALLALPLMPATPIYAAVEVDEIISQQSDSCRVAYNGAAWTISLTDVTTAGYYNAGYQKMGSGLRFQTVAVPGDATITEAHLTLTPSSSQTATIVNTRITGEDVDDAATFSDIANYQARRGTVVGGANNNYITTAQIDWDGIGATTINVEIDSPDIKTIIQEIVDRDGWASGNDMVLFWDDHDARGTQSDGVTKRAYSYNLSDTKCAKLHIEYTTVPTVTNGVGPTLVEATTARLNGNLTNDRNVDTTVHVYWGNEDGVTTAENWDNDVNLGVKPEGAFYTNIDTLDTGTTYYYRCYATNTGGDDWADSTESFLTKPAAPTNVAATDGVHTDKVVVTWTKSTGATGYKVYRDGGLIDTIGDVATYDDTGADASVITPGTAAASDETSTAHVSLSLSGQSVANGTTHTYKLKATNATGDSVDSSTNTGYRGHGSLTYQWQRSANDSDASYSNITGATTAAYNDTGAPSDGSGRYFRCVVSATGAASQNSAVNRGYRGPPAAPTGFSATTVSNSEIDLDWTKGVCSSKTFIVRKTGSYPVNRTDGINVYFDTGTDFSDTELEYSTAYYYKAWAYSSGSDGYSAASDEDVALTSSMVPEVTTRVATRITRTTAQPNAFLNDDGGTECDAIFEYDTDSGVPYALDTDWVEGYTTNQPIYALIEELEPGMTYYYRVKVRNSAGTVVGLEKSFQTQTILGNPSNLLASAVSAYSISLSWASGEGSSQTIIRYDTGGYPATFTDGEYAYVGDKQTCLVENLNPGTTYYFRVWAEDGGEYSPKYASDLATTMAGMPTVDRPTEAGTPEGWWLETDSTVLVNVPLYSSFNQLYGAFGWSNDTGWMILALIVTAGLGYIALGVSHSALIMIIVFGFFIITFCWMHILPLYILAFLIPMGGGIAYLKGRA